MVALGSQCYKDATKMHNLHKKTRPVDIADLSKILILLEFICIAAYKMQLYLNNWKSDE